MKDVKFRVKNWRIKLSFYSLVVVLPIADCQLFRDRSEHNPKRLQTKSYAERFLADLLRFEILLFFFN